MEITRVGRSCFRIKYKRTILLTDPYQGLKNRTAHILLFSSLTFDSQKIKWGEQMADLKRKIKIRGEPALIFGPGEYEVRNIRIRGFKEKGKTIYLIKIGGLSLLYLDRLEEKIAEEKVELFNEVDVLFLSVLKPKVASLLISQLEPSVVVPMEKEGVEDFLKQEGREKVDQVKKLVLLKGQLPEEEEIVLLK